MTMKRKMTILVEPDAILSKILISASLFKKEAKMDGYHFSNGSLSRTLDFKCLKLN